MSDQRENWEHTRMPVICQQCDWRFLGSTDGLPSVCPHCGSHDLASLEVGEAEFPYTYPPELVVPLSVDANTLAARVGEFARGIPFAPPDLSPATLQRRLQTLFLPMWLVDSDVTAQWQAEVGYDYEVVSHQERYADGAGWRTDEVRETRIRWEPRVGTLQRHYDNVAAPALETHAVLHRVLGGFRLQDALPFDAGRLGAAVVRAPDRAPDAAWSEATEALRQLASQDCQQAAGADHVRDYRWSPIYDSRNWTLLLLPVLATAYLDDEGLPRRVLINGQTGQIYGARRGSAARAGRLSLIIGAVALVVFVVGLAMALLSPLFPPLLALGVIAALLGVLAGVGAVVPVARVWAFNRKQDRTPVEV